MTSDEAMHRIDGLLAHVWMVRTFIKHSEEAEEDDELQEIYRKLYDYMLALGGPWKAFCLDKMPARHERMAPQPMTVYQHKQPHRVEIDKKGNPIAIYRGAPKWQVKNLVRERVMEERKHAGPDKRGLRGGLSSDTVAKLTVPNEGQASKGV